jgi:hypothetical protein
MIIDVQAEILTEHLQNANQVIITWGNSLWAGSAYLS